MACKLRIPITTDTAVEGMKEKLSAGTAKLSKAAKLRKSDTQLMKLSNAAVEEREARNRGGEPSLNRLQIGAHLGILFFTFLSICLMAAVAAFQAKWIKVCEYPQLKDVERRTDAQQPEESASRCSSFCSTLCSLHAYSPFRLLMTGGSHIARVALVEERKFGHCCDRSMVYRVAGRLAPEENQNHTRSPSVKLPCLPFPTSHRAILPHFHACTRS